MAKNNGELIAASARRRIQNFLLVWLDNNLDESVVKFKTSLDYLKRAVSSISTWNNSEDCIEFIKTVKDEKIFMIISNTIGKRIIPQIESLSQIDSIYILCNDTTHVHDWLKSSNKVKGSYTKVESIYESLKIDREQCDRALIAINYSGIDALFMYTQLFKEALLQIEDDDEQSIKDLAEYCRTGNDLLEEEIQLVERDYHDHSPIWWYTAPYFIYSTLNRGLREMNADIILKFGFFIRHLHNHIAELHRKQQNGPNRAKAPFILYRGQGLPNESFEKMKKTKGGLMSFNNFLSTSRSRELSLDMFARPAIRSTSDNVGILFVMKIDPDLCQQFNIPFVDVSEVGYFQADEAEILFTTHTIFRIDRIDSIPDKKYQGRLWEVELTLTSSDNESEMGKLTEHLREDFERATGWNRIGWLLLQVGHPAKAQRLYQILLEKSATDDDKVVYHNQLGSVYSDKGEYSKALEAYERSLQIKRKNVPLNHPELASSYNNIGTVYCNMGEYSKALESYEKSHEILKRVLDPMDPALASSYNNLGVAYKNLGKNSKALESYEKSLEIRKVTLPANHPDLAICYNNMGNVYNNMKEYAKALKSYERSLEIDQIALPPNHPGLATDYNNLGMVYSNMGQYSEALKSHKKSLEIDQIALSSNHPDLASDYNNIGVVYEAMRDYSQALSYFEKAHGLWQTIFPASHPRIINVKRNIEGVKKNM